MATLLYHHPVFARHDTGPGHPECPDRIHAVMAALEQPEFGALDRRDAPLAERDHIARLHPQTFIDRVQAAIPTASDAGLRAIDADTVVSPDSWEAALRATGSTCAAVDAVLAGEADNAFCAVRPPGHHAEPEQAMGFCIFNSVAVAALHAIAVHGLRKVAVVDFDVHHGNGTQAAFWDRPECLFLSSHQSPLYPGTGTEFERGASDNIINAPLPPYSSSREIRQAWDNTLGPALDSFDPDLILISAGFDAHADDPLAQLEFSSDDYRWLTEQILAIAQRRCQGRVVSSLEGGYDLRALADSTAAHVRALLNFSQKL